MSNVLAIETSSSVGSVCVLRDGGAFGECAGTDVKLSAWLLPAIDRVLGKAGLTRLELDVVAFGNGPGSFTGVRTACASAQALAYALGKPLFAIDSMEAYALSALHATIALDGLPKLIRGTGSISVILDARMNELYRQDFTFARGEKLQENEPSFSVTASTPPTLVPAEQCGPLLGFAVGSGALLLRRSDVNADAEIALVQRISERAEANWANAVANIANARWLAGEAPVSPVAASPNYVRNDVAKTEIERARAVSPLHASAA